MIDRENVIENLEQNIRWIEEIECHQFPGWLNVTMAMRDAAELLKEQGPKIGNWVDSAGADKCSVCGATYSDLYPDYQYTRYCPNCGAKMEVKCDG